MRFLLNVKNTASATLSKGKKGPRPPEIQNETGTIRAWGQQCSPNCGCTIRFEATMDAKNNNKIVSASYDAKTIVSQVQKRTVEHGQLSTFLQPVRTQSRDANGVGVGSGRPMTKECKCKTLHGLAETITKVLPSYSLAQAQNQLEYAGMRSSPAFRYSALKNLDLISADVRKQSINTRTMLSLNGDGEGVMNEKGGATNVNDIPEGKCYDLVEEALMACIQGYIPKPRPAGKYQRINAFNHPHQRDLVQRIRTTDANNDNEGNLDPLRFVAAAKRRAKEGILQSFSPSSSSSPSSAVTSAGSSSSTPMSSMPPFHLMADASHDDGHTPMDTLTEIKMEIESMNEENKKLAELNSALHSWVAYVDEKHNARS